MIVNASIWGMLKDLVQNGVFIVNNAGAPTSGTSGTGANLCGPGTLLIDRTNDVLYINTNTKASPLWVAITANNTAINGLGVVGVAKAQYNFAVDGGAVGLITPAANAIIPANAIIIGGSIDILTTFTSGGSATIAVGTSAGSAANSLKTATAVASWTAGQLAMIPVFTAATYLKLTAAGSLTLTVATAALTAGKANIHCVYLQSN